MRLFKQILSVFSHALLGGVAFLVAYLAAILYFMSLVYPRQDCPGVIDRPLAVNAAGDQVRMKDQTCGIILRIRTVSLYLVDKDGDTWRFFSYTPDRATPHVVWTSNDRISVELPSAYVIQQMGRLKGISVDYDIKRVMP